MLRFRKLADGTWEAYRDEPKKEKGLHDMTVAELKALATDKGLILISNTKQAIIAEIEEHERQGA